MNKNRRTDRPVTWLTETNPEKQRWHLGRSLCQKFKFKSVSGKFRAAVGQHTSPSGDITSQHRQVVA